MSIIKATAMKLGISCAEFFTAVTSSKYPHVVKDKNFEVLANKACQTKYTDSIWKLAAMESSFTSNILTFNRMGKVVGVYRNKEAINKAYELNVDKNRYLSSDVAVLDRPNIDIGILQINLRYHGHENNFNFDVLKMLSPSNQIDYLVNVLAPRLKNLCDKDWLYCYHSPFNTEFQNAYAGRLEKISQKLDESVIKNYSFFKEKIRQERIQVIESDPFYKIKIKNNKQNSRNLTSRFAREDFFSYNKFLAGI